jgi:hypothetical protein
MIDTFVNDPLEDDLEGGELEIPKLHRQDSDKSIPDERPVDNSNRSDIAKMS